MMTPQEHDARLLAAWWKYGGEDKPLPITSGHLDAALAKCHGAFSHHLESTLIFIETDQGIRCTQLPEILKSALETGIIVVDREASLQITEAEAQAIIHRHHISPKLAVEFGKALRRSWN